jgi:thiosulfate/3-mercaptopyruvate sulfurtransferase
VLHVGRNEEEYLDGHVPGAVFVPLGSIVAEIDGVPNQLPAVPMLTEAFRAAGVSDDSHVVVYGDLGGLAATRAFFTLEYLGHPRVSVLDGGLDAWKSGRHPVSSNPPAPTRGEFEPKPRPDLVVDAELVKNRLAHAGTQILDARPPAEFTGSVPGGGIERPGHIPGALNVFWRSTLRGEADPRLQPPAALQAIYRRGGITPGRTVLAYCRTGMQASHAYFVARYLGYDVRLYDGSFFDWSRRPELPVAR